MPAKKGFSERVWEDIINGDMAGNWIDATIESAKQRPDEPFADTGPLLEAILRKGVTKEELCRLARSIRYETVFETVQLAAEEELDADQLDGVHEELLTADPSGKDGRPGSWPVEPVRLTKAARIAMQTKPQATAPTAARPKRGRKQDDPDAPLLTLPKGQDFAFAADGTQLWLAHTSINASTVRGFAVPGGEAFAEFNSLPNLRGVAVSPGGKQVATSSHGGMVAVHDAASGKEVWKTPKTNQETRQIVYSPDGSMVLNSGSETCVRRRDAATGKELAALDFGSGWIAGDLAFSTDGNTLAVRAVKVPGKEYISFWGWRAAKELGRHEYDAASSAIEYLPDGSGLLIAGYRGVEVWSVTSHQRVDGFEVKQLKGVSLHPGGKMVALNTYGGSEIRAFPSGELLKRLDTNKMYPDHFAFSPDGRHVLLVASPESFLWNVEALLGRAPA